MLSFWVFFGSSFQHCPVKSELPDFLLGNDQVSSIFFWASAQPSALDGSHSSWSFLWSGFLNPAWVLWLIAQGQASSQLLLLPNDLVELHQTVWLFLSIRMSWSSIILFLANNQVSFVALLLGEQPATRCHNSFTSMFLGVSVLLKISWARQDHSHTIHGFVQAMMFLQ